MFFYEMRYVIMRAARLIVAMVAESVCFASAICTGVAFGFAMLAVLCLVEGQWSFFFKTWGIFAALIVTVVTTWSLSFTAGMPYRYKTSIPGVELVDCKKCGRRIPNLFHCPECGKFRSEKTGFALVKFASIMVTAAWAVHDVTLAVILFIPTGGRK